jgi:hypothetical protein
VTGHCGRAGPLRNERRDVRRKALGEEEWWYSCKLFGMNSLTDETVWHVDLLLGNDCETSNCATDIAKQWVYGQACVHDNREHSRIARNRTAGVKLS